MQIAAKQKKKKIINAFLPFHLQTYFHNFLASLKNLGEKTANLFERKKKDAEQIAAEKSAEAQKYIEDQLKKSSEAVAQTKNEVGKMVSDTGK